MVSRRRWPSRELRRRARLPFDVGARSHVGRGAEADDAPRRSSDRPVDLGSHFYAYFYLFPPYLCSYSFFIQSTTCLFCVRVRAAVGFPPFIRRSLSLSEEDTFSSPISVLSLLFFSVWGWGRRGVLFSSPTSWFRILRLRNSTSPFAVGACVSACRDGWCRLRGVGGSVLPLLLAARLLGARFSTALEEDKAPSAASALTDFRARLSAEVAGAPRNRRLPAATFTAV